ncbi:MAG TPA: DsbA family oxidoreductase [Flavobacteriales bacterium]|nr:DsbA family oxidoreductase [Flavobacteriales bacterium]
MNIKVDIWSDVMCPFCYIGKRKFEKALEHYKYKNQVEVEWHSYQLDPDLNPPPGVNVYDYLAQRKRITQQESVRMHEQVTKLAASVGLIYNFDKAVVANSFNAHRLLQLAKTKGLGSQMEEELFKAYFTEGKNTGDPTILHELGINVGLLENELKEMLNGNAYTEKIKEDEARAREIGLRGVPFFLLDNKYVISGAQDSSLFLQALNQLSAEKGITTI